MSAENWLKGWDAVREYGENRYSIQQSPGFQEVACIKDLKNPEMNDCMDAVANLIAAAPDLLEALEAAIFRLETFIEAEREMPIPSMEVILDAFNRAIAKAKGNPCAPS